MLPVMTLLSGWDGRRQVCVCVSAECAQASTKEHSCKLFCFGVQLLTTGKQRDAQFWSPVCSPLIPGSGGWLEDMEQRLGHTAVARNKTYNVPSPQEPTALTETSFLPTLVTLGPYHYNRLWRHLSLSSEQFTILLADLPQEKKMRASFCLNITADPARAADLNLQLDRVQDPVCFPFWINAYCWLEEAGSSVAGRAGEPEAC